MKPRNNKKSPKACCRLCCRAPYHGSSNPQASLYASSSSQRKEDYLDPVHAWLALPAKPSPLSVQEAQQVAAFATAKAREAKHVLMNNNNADRRMAPLEWSELHVGRLLGVGGFAHVSEITRITLNENASSSCYPTNQQAAREFLSQHALRRPGEGQEDEDEDHHDEEEEEPQEAISSNSVCCRYAIKHLRSTLLLHPHKFAKAAMDLAAEGQVLASLQHAHILKVRGQTAQGPAAYASTTSHRQQHDAFFLLLDRIVETLQVRIGTWRQQQQQQGCRPSCQQKDGTRRFSLTRMWSRSSIKKQEEQQQEEEGGQDEHDLYETKCHIARNIASALAYLHSRRILFRDMKSANLGFDIRNEIKLFDFGLARVVPQGKAPDETFLMSFVGTQGYQAPEIVQQLPYNASADVYSLGCVFWEMMAMASVPSGSKRRIQKWQRKYHASKNKEQPIGLPICPCWPQLMQDLLTGMLQDEASHRWSAQQVVDALQQQAHPQKPQRRSTFQLDVLADLQSQLLRQLEEGDNDDEDQASHTSFSTLSSTVASSSVR